MHPREIDTAARADDCTAFLEGGEGMVQRDGETEAEASNLDFLKDAMQVVRHQQQHLQHLGERA